MKLALVNGSPRGKKSNSDKILKWITPDVQTEKVYAIKYKQHEEAIERIASCDYFIFIFPLYTDSVPGVFKKFLEAFSENKQLFEKKPILFIIHSGFTEAIHSRAIEKYIEYFAKTIMNMNYQGCIVMGGSEALQTAPEEFFSKRIKEFSILQENVLNLEPLNKGAIKKIARIETFNKPKQWVMKILHLSNFYWDAQLKKNGAFKNRWDTPYTD